VSSGNPNLSGLIPPFSLALPGTDGELHCRRAVRTLPGRRLVCAGSWQGRNVYAKLFFNTRKAKRDWQRELRGIGHLQAAGIPTPPLLYSGYSPQCDCHVMVLAEIAPAETLNQVWEKTSGGQDRETLLKTMARVFAEHHNAGIVQSDPHLNNFLVAKDGVYTLDGADISRHNAPLKPGPALRNLAAFFSIIYRRPNDLARIFFDAYAAARTPPLQVDHYHRFTSLTLKTRDRNIRKYLKNKIFRECTAFSRRRSFRRLVMLSRRYDSPGIQQLISTPAALLNTASAKSMKQGNTATLASVRIDGKDIVIKHYRVKGILHGLRKACLRSRAETSWINAHRLQRYGIRTAQPVALIMNTVGPFRLDSFFITEHVPGPNAAVFFNSTTISLADKTAAAHHLSELLRRLAENRLHHGDLKATNIIISGLEPVLLDLDSMQQYGSDTKKFRHVFKKDLERFKRNWNSGSDIDALLRELTDKVAMEFL